MKRAPLLVTVLLAAGVQAQTLDVAAYLQDISVTIRAGASEGSGVIVTRAGPGGPVNFVWTAAHVIEPLRQSGGFADAVVVKELIEQGRRVGQMRMDARVVRYSDKQDLALLEIRKKDFVQASGRFYLDPNVPPVGTPLYHVGSMLGQLGANSMCEGIISQIGRVYDHLVYDQTTVPAYPGCSGGGVYLKDGRYLGMVVRGAGVGFNLIVPVRRMRQWAEQAQVLWALDANTPMPTPEELAALPVEHFGSVLESGPAPEAPPLTFPAGGGR